MCYSFQSCHRNDDRESDSHLLKQDVLSWRQPKDESFSDWNITVKVGDQTTTYYVHKNILGVGPKRSIYFNKLFHSQHIKEAKNNTSELCLPPSAASAFPIMLDYMYSKEDKLDIKTENATALRHISDYFDVPDLFEKVNDFIQNDVNTENLIIYLNEATSYVDEPLICGLFNTMSGTWCNSESMSIIIAKYIQDQNLEISNELFHSLTSYKNLPKISPKYAIFFIKLYEKYPRVKSNNTTESLLSRCAKTFASWDDMSMFMLKTEHCTKDETETNLNMRIYKSLSLQTRVDFLECALYHQREEKKATEDKIRGQNGFISVSDAGIKSVNGVYYYSIEEDCYKKRGFWNDKMGDFVIRSQSGYPFYNWYLLFNNYDGETYIYSHQRNALPSASNSVPDRGWREVGKGNGPPPVCRLLRNHSGYSEEEQPYGHFH